VFKLGKNLGCGYQSEIMNVQEEVAQSAKQANGKKKTHTKQIRGFGIVKIKSPGASALSQQKPPNSDGIRRILSPSMTRAGISGSGTEGLLMYSAIVVTLLRSCECSVWSGRLRRSRLLGRDGRHGNYQGRRKP
jgi:hypothetical protein